ncbi:hypothetical protein ACSBR2_038619 [Camellia fascicularis]
MARERAPVLRTDALEDDDGVALEEKYMVEKLVERGTRMPPCPTPPTMISAVQPISQVAPDHWHTNADKSTLTMEDLERIRTKY